MSIRHKLLKLFDGQGNQVLSGQLLAKRLGVTRTSVWKHVLALQNAGIPIQSVGRHGYRLEGHADFSLSDLLAPDHAKQWYTPHYHVSTASTQTLAKAGAALQLPEGHVWVAETQSGGRGRLDRKWESPFGGLWFSLLLRPKLAPAQVPSLTLTAGWVLSSAIKAVIGIDAKLKWPNDLLIREGKHWKKCAGILTEMSGQLDRTEWVVLGVGLNVNNVIPAALRNQAIALAEKTHQTIPRKQLFDVFMRLFHTAYGTYKKEGFDAFRTDYWASYSRPNDTVRLKSSFGVIQGIVRGVDASGALIVESRRKIRHLSEGEIVS